MAGRAKPNELGLLERDYLYHFVKWKVPKRAQIVAHSHSISLADCEAQFIEKYGPQCHPKRSRLLHVVTARTMLKRHLERIARQLLGSRRMTVEAEAFLLQLLPESRRQAPRVKRPVPFVPGELARNAVYEYGPDGQLRETTVFD